MNKRNLKGKTDDEIRAYFIDGVDNGSYALTICKNCGSFSSSLDGRTDRAEIVNVCKECFDEFKVGAWAIVIDDEAMDCDGGGQWLLYETQTHAEADIKKEYTDEEIKEHNIKAEKRYVVG